MMSIKDGVMSGELSEICPKVRYSDVLCVCADLLLYLCLCVRRGCDRMYREKAGLQLIFGN